MNTDKLKWPVWEEREFAAFVHRAHGVAAMNGTVTLEIGIVAADERR
ncbi:MAG: hypothetical protein ABSH32_34110 [Bryobacteraceae bacterium]|jgi:dTDP-4-amino-4,6-dideoxygalactose transaminase